MFKMASTENTSTTSRERTMQYEDNLPSLPVPPLEKTLEKYLASAKPFVTPEEYRQTEDTVRDFGSGVGKVLQQKLEERGKTHKNWIEKWWEEIAYLESRGPIGVLGVMLGVLPALLDIWPPRDGTQVERASKSIWTITKYFDMTRKEEIPVMKNNSGSQVFSMQQIRSLFCTSRIPGEPKDRMERRFKTEAEGTCPSHITVFCNGHIFRLEVFDENGLQYGSNEILRQLRAIKERSKDRGQCVGILTADDRTSWAKAYDHLCELDPNNVKHLETITTSIVCVALDDHTPKNVMEVFMEVGAGENGYDRWFDKSYTMVYFRTGTVGSVSDHTAYDGIMSVMFSIWGDDFLARTTTKWIGSPEIHSERGDPEELIFTIDNHVDEAKAHAFDTYNKNRATLDIFSGVFPCFGRDWTKNSGFHPDGFMQMAIQLAYYTRHKSVVPCYETGTTRTFYHGRTETIRSTSSEMLEWVKSMHDPNVQKSEKIELMRVAHAKHLQLGAEALNGQGIDRHFLGLYALARDMEGSLPAIFTDPTFMKCGGAGNFVLSTSLLGFQYAFGCVAPMCSNGYGVFYNILNDGFYVIVTAFNKSAETNTLELYEDIHRSLVTMQQLVETEAKL